jgi:hypothetical protein
MFYALALISILVVMILLKTIVEILPSILACLIRWKENINIEASVRLSRDRDFSSIAMLLPFCLVIFRFRVYNPGFIANLADTPRLWAVIGIFAAYVLIRKAAAMLVHPRRVPQKTLSATEKSANTYFILLTLVLLLVGSSCSFFGASLNVIRVTCIWLSALIYGLYLIRKVQIFASSCSLFAAFLYLCALEILPTGILVASDIIF